MDFSLTEQQRMLQRSARDFFAKELPKSLVKEMIGDRMGYPRDLWGKMAEVGWMALAVPERYEGCGERFVDLVILLEEMGRACLPGPFFSTAMLGAATILEAGSEEQKRRLLPRVVRGELILTLALIEPQAVHDPDCFEVTAQVGPDGYTIHGTKLFVPDAHVANKMICAARTEKGITLFLVDTANPAVTCASLPTVAGDKQCEVRFDGARVTAEDIVGTVDEGWPPLQRVLAKAAVAKCAELVGGAQQVLELTLGYAKDRVQFGRPIGSFQATQHHCANMATDVECSRALTYQAAWLIDEGLHCAKEVAMAKAWVSEACRRVSALGVQIHGGIGFCWEHDMHLYFKQAKLGEISFGDSAYHQEIVASELGL